MTVQTGRRGDGVGWSDSGNWTLSVLSLSAGGGEKVKARVAYRVRSVWNGSLTVPIPITGGWLQVEWHYS